MDKNLEVNRVVLTGRVLSGPVYNHKTYGEAFYMVVIGVLRKSGYEDKLRLIVSERILGGKSPQIGEVINVVGQIRTYNRDDNGRNKLEVVVFVREIEYFAEEFEYTNNVYIEGFLCKEPIRRKTPMGRELCDLMIAVNRLYNKSDYVPMIAWGRNAFFSEILEVGDKVFIEGRIQSRDYRKYTEDCGLIMKTAYEVSITGIEVM
jgi:single-stranded DNA-binding protein